MCLRVLRLQYTAIWNDRMASAQRKPVSSGDHVGQCGSSLLYWLISETHTGPSRNSPILRVLHRFRLCTHSLSPLPLLAGESHHFQVLRFLVAGALLPPILQTLSPPLSVPPTSSQPLLVLVFSDILHSYANRHPLDQEI